MNFMRFVYCELIIILLNLRNKKGKISMDRDIPCFNRPIIEKIQRKNQQKHLQRLRNIRSGNSNRTMPISSNNHSLSNKKAVMAQEDKKCEIQKQNVLLFNKMMRIMKRNDPYNQPNRTQMSRVNKAAVFEVSRINQQNKCMFQRLQQQRPTISNKRLQEDRLKNLNILRFLGKYPNPLATRTSYDTTGSSQMGRQTEIKRKSDTYQYRDSNLKQFELDQSMYDKQLRNYQNQVQKIKQKSLQASRGRRKFMSQAVPRNNKIESQESEKANNFDSVQQQHYRVQARQASKTSAKSQYNQHVNNGHINKQIILFQKNSLIAKQMALVEFIRLYDIYKIRAVFQQKIKGQNIYQLEIPEQEGNEFFSEQNYDYGKICRMLVIQDGYLVVNPNLITSQSSREVMKSNPSQKAMVQSNKKLANIFSEQNNKNENQWAKYEEALEESID